MKMHQSIQPATVMMDAQPYFQTPSMPCPPQYSA
jgi:hypothetical protein